MDKKIERVKIIDCTLRDGGYYNDWDFDDNMASRLIESLSKSGVDIVEMGYKSSTMDGFWGLFRYCAEGQLEQIKKYNLEFAFMIDAKEFIRKDETVDEDLLKRCIKPQNESLFSWCRIATNYSMVDQAVKMAETIKGMGYKVTMNLMGVSLLTEGQITDALKKANQARSDVFYFADSFGNFLPEDVVRLIIMIKSHFSGAVGIHTHDNQGLAFANTLSALGAGVDYIDATVSGMGRGAGNLKLEQILLALYFNYDRRELNPYALLDAIEQDFIPLHKKYLWGWDFSYMLSGLKNIHPTYCQRLKSSHQYTITQVARILDEIPSELRNKFNLSKLDEISTMVIKQKKEQEGDAIELPIWQVQPITTALVVATGPSVKRYSRALRAFIEKHNPYVIECNSTGMLTGLRRSVAILNQVRLSEHVGTELDNMVKEVIVGLRSVPNALFKKGQVSLECITKADCFEINGTQVTIPDYVVGMFAMGVALLCRPRKIYLAGFDGFSDKAREEDHKSMQKFWQLFKEVSQAQGVEITSILPTLYDIPVKSVYSLIE